jgi:hypothetical protein
MVGGNSSVKVVDSPRFGDINKRVAGWILAPDSLSSSGPD